jgi:LuxR family transcriptional regulator, maltose regulon positive regulatory protein
MSTPILATKLYVPQPRLKVVSRPNLFERLNEGLRRKLILVSAPAGFGKTTLVSEWVAGCERPVAWLSLDERDNDPARFLTYLILALQMIEADIGAGILKVLQSPELPSTEPILTTLLNEITAIPGDFILVLDDYHVLDAKPVDHIVTFLLEHLPPQMHLVIATREDPHLPLARLRVQSQLTELRAADLRFTPAEAAGFLNQVMGLNLSAENIAALETRTEGWIAGLQLAALSMQGYQDVTGFIKSFTGSHHFVLDYLVEEVLRRQPESIQTFLLRTSILDRMCGPLCDAVLLDPSIPGQETLENLERANLFIVPLDNERGWYRYHHLFGGFLRQRLQHSASSGNKEGNPADYHIRASIWFQNHDLMPEAFHHAAAANDVERAVRLMESKEMPLHLPGVATEILNWLDSLPTTVRNAQPALWWKQASLLLTIGQTTMVEEKLQATEAALASAGLPGAEPDDMTRNLIGKIAVARASLAVTQHRAETILVQSRRALEYLHPDNLSYRSDAIRAMGYAYYLQGDRAASGQAYAEALSIAQAAGNIVATILATTSLGQIQQLENQLYQATETYKSVLQLIGDYSHSNAMVAYFGLARICYEWNDLDAAEQYGEQSMKLALQYDQIVNRFIVSAVFLARLKLVRGDVSGALELLTQAEQSARQHNFTHQMPEVVAVQVLVLLRQGSLDGALQLAKQYELPISQARVLIAQSNPSAALAVLEPFRQQMETQGWVDKRLKAIVLQAIALYLKSEKKLAIRVLGEALTLAEPGGFIRLFVDEGPLMAELLFEAVAHGIMPDYTGKLLAAFEPEKRKNEGKPDLPPSPSVQPLSQRELEVLRLIALGLSNREICERLFLALDTVKGHNRLIFEKLQVQRRTEAVARARELGLL